jgi:beta-glucosidase
MPNGETIYAGLKAAFKAGGGTTELSPNGTYKMRPDVAIVVYGEDAYAEFQGDVMTLEYRPGDKHDLELLKRLKADGIPVVSVFLSGRPLWVNPEINASDAFVAAWLPGSEGGGIADVLVRKPDGSVNHDFKGKLSFSWPRTPTQTVNRGDGETAQFAYGFGLASSDKGDLAQLSEDVPRETNATDSRTYFAKGRPGTGWRLFIQEAGGPRIDVSATRGATGSGSVSVVPEDRAAQEDSRSLRWSGAAAGSFGVDGNSPVDLRREANGQLSLAVDYKVTAAPSAEVRLALQCGASCEGSVPVTQALKSAPVGEWRQLKILLSCFGPAGANLERITAPAVVSTAGQLGLSISSVRLETGLNDLMPCPQ